MYTISLKNQCLGTEPDGLTKIYKPYFYINTGLNSGFRDKIKEICKHPTQNDISGVRIHVDDVLNIINETQIKDHPPKSVIHWLQNIPTEPINMEHINQRLNYTNVTGKLGWKNLHLFQKIAVQRIVSGLQSLLAFDMGTGKTVIATMVAAYLDVPFIVLTTASMVGKWKEEIIEWIHLTDEQVFKLKSAKELEKKQPTKKKSRKKTLEERMKVRKCIVASHHSINNKNTLDHFKEFLIHGGLIIVDESQCAKNMSAGITKNIIRLSKVENVKSILLTGTPMTRHIELYSQIFILNKDIFPVQFSGIPHKVRVREAFVDRYCNPREEYKGNKLVWNFNGQDHPEELNTILNQIMIRLKKEDALPDLPEMKRMGQLLPPLTNDQIMEIQEILQEDTISSFSSAFRMAGLYKIPSVINYLRTMIKDVLKARPNRQIILFFNHTPMRLALKELMTELKTTYFEIFGETAKDKRSEYESDFQNKKYQFALLSIRACNAGLTLTKSDLVVFTELLFNNSSLVQAECRAYRLTQVRDVDVLYLIQPNTPDYTCLEIVKRKEKNSSYTIDGTTTLFDITIFPSHKIDKPFLTLIDKVPFINKQNINEENETQRKKMKTE